MNSSRRNGKRGSNGFLEVKIHLAQRSCAFFCSIGAKSTKDLFCDDWLLRWFVACGFKWDTRFGLGVYNATAMKRCCFRLSAAMDCFGSAVRYRAVIGLALLFIMRCFGDQNAAALLDQTVAAGQAGKVAYTYVSPDGNRWLPSAANFKHAHVVDVPLSGSANWVVALPSAKGSTWVVALQDGRLEKIVVEDKSVVSRELMAEKIPAGMPPIIKSEADGKLQVLNHHMKDVSRHTGGVVFGKDLTFLAYLTTQGNLVVHNLVTDETRQIEMDALPDSRILVDAADRLLVLCAPREYDHGALGDKTEATAIALLDTRGELRVTERFSLPEETVFEGLYPLWMDLDGDGAMEIVVTLCNNTDGEGARLAVFDEAGTLLAKGHLSPGGWRHQLVVVPAEHNASWQIADIQKPHVQRIAHFYQYANGTLELKATREGYSSHKYGSRNLDMALAGDLDADGQTELLVPSVKHDRLHALSLEEDMVADKWHLAVGGRLASNLQTVRSADGRLILGAVNHHKKLRLWISDK